MHMHMHMLTKLIAVFALLFNLAALSIKGADTHDSDSGRQEILSLCPK